MTQHESDRWERLTELLTPFHGKALGTARKLAGSVDDGDELFQETLLRAFERLDSLREESSFRSWFFAVLLTRHRSRCRRAFWSRFLPLDDLVAGGKEPAAAPEPGDDERWRAQRAGLALARLPAEQREAIVLHDIDGFPVDEVAAMQGVTPSAVKSRLSRGRARVRRLYEQRGWLADAGRNSLSRARLATSPGGIAPGDEV